MRNLILAALTAVTLTAASSSAFAGYYVPGVYAPPPVYVPTYNCVPGYYGPICGWN